MTVFSDPNEISYKDRARLCERGTAVALGFFDGVHVAHRALLECAKTYAEMHGLAFAVFTFSQSSGIKGGASRIYTDEEKLSLLKECGAQYVYLCDFGRVRDLSPESFVNDILIGKLFAKVTVCGFNFRFGNGACADASILSSLMKERGGAAIVKDELSISGRAVSSTLIKELILNKKISEANRLLGKPYFLTGDISHGLGIGRGMGIPTVNISLSEERFAPPDGVYSTATVIDGVVYTALTNVGKCPTFGERGRHTETFILDYSGDLYGKSLRIYFLEYLREEKKFSSEKDLIMQINVDKERALKLTEEIKWQEIGLS